MVLFRYMVGYQSDHPELGVVGFVHTPFDKPDYLFPVHGDRLPCHVFLFDPAAFCRQTFRHRVLLGLITAYHIFIEKGMSRSPSYRFKCF
jgi:hypothetical protein